MGGSYRARRQYGETPQINTYNTSSQRPISQYTIPSENDTSHIALGMINEYQFENGDDTSNQSPPSSPLISTVSKSLQSLGKKIGAVVDKTKKNKKESSSSSSSSSSTQPIPIPPRPIKRTESPQSIYLQPGTNDDNDWPNGMRIVGTDGGDGQWYYRDQNGVGYESYEGCKFGWVTRMD